jgi:hypothetical protein
MDHGNLVRRLQRDNTAAFKQSRSAGQFSESYNNSMARRLQTYRERGHLADVSHASAKFPGKKYRAHLIPKFKFPPRDLGFRRFFRNAAHLPAESLNGCSSLLRSPLVQALLLHFPQLQ